MAIELEAKQTAELTDGLTPEQRDLRKLFLLSFQYSQGVSFIQHDLFRWDILNGFMPPSQDLPEQAPLYIVTITPPRLHMRFNLNQYITEKREYEGQMQHEWTNLTKIVKKENDKSIIKEYLIEDLAAAMIKRDLAFQYRERPGRESSQAAVPDSYEDPHKSFVRRHAVMKVPSGHPAYDTLFEEIAKVVERYKAENQGKSPIETPIEVPPGKEVADGVINQLDASTALMHLVFAWNANHSKSGETFFGNPEVNQQLPVDLG